MKFAVVSHAPSLDPSDFGVARLFIKSVDPLVVCKDLASAELFDLERASQVILRLSNPTRKLSLVPVALGDPMV